MQNNYYLTLGTYAQLRQGRWVFLDNCLDAVWYKCIVCKIHAAVFPSYLTIHMKIPNFQENLAKGFSVCLFDQLGFYYVDFPSFSGSTSVCSDH